MVDQGKDLSQTAAGNALFQWLTRVIEELRGLLKRLKTVLAVNKGNTIVAEDLRKDISTTEKKLRQAEQQQRGFGRSNRTFAEVVRGGGRSRSSSVGCGVIVSSPTESVASSTSLQSVLESGRKWLAAKNLLGHGVAAAEIAPVPFLKGVVSLSLKIVESIEAMNRTERSLVVLARSARKFCIIIEQQKAIKNLSEDVRHALQDLVEELKEVQAVLQRMSSYGRTHRYILQQADEHVLSSCNQSIHDAYNLFMMRCVIAIHQDIQEWKQSQLATIHPLSPLRNATL
ncbi:hypothetical protein FRC17_004597 [Serendipita sp. 399]|nr:hypothetical protein FRC17_004597 [Serendipita sp. 399]